MQVDISREKNDIKKTYLLRAQWTAGPRSGRMRVHALSSRFVLESQRRHTVTFPLQGNFTNVLRSIGCALVLVGYDECIALLKAYV